MNRQFISVRDILENQYSKSAQVICRMLQTFHTLHINRTGDNDEIDTMFVQLARVSRKWLD